MSISDSITLSFILQIGRVPGEDILARQDNTWRGNSPQGKHAEQRATGQSASAG